MWVYSGVCSFRHVDCQKFLIRAIIKELRRLFSTESHCLIAGYTHTEYRWRMCLVGLCLHSNYWQPHRNLPVRHAMHKPKNTLKKEQEPACENKCIYSFLKGPNMHYFHQRKQIDIFHGWLPESIIFSEWDYWVLLREYLWFVCLFAFCLFVFLHWLAFCFFQKLLCLLSESRNHINMIYECRQGVQREYWPKYQIRLLGNFSYCKKFTKFFA